VAAADSAAFVELPRVTCGDGARMVVELVGPAGNRMRVEAAGEVDLAGLAQVFFGRDAR
jgi:hypothetical protein